jgi:hypothetical protein
MASIRGRLLIGGMTLHDVAVVLEGEGSTAATAWRGHLLIEPLCFECIEVSRPYRVELDDGRAGQLVVSRVKHVPGEERLRAEFVGQSKLAANDAANGSLLAPAAQQS